MCCHVQVHAKDEGGNSTSGELLWLEETMHEEAEHKAAYAGVLLSLMASDESTFKGWTHSLAVTPMHYVVLTTQPLWPQPRRTLLAATLPEPSSVGLQMRLIVWVRSCIGDCQLYL